MYHYLVSWNFAFLAAFIQKAVFCLTIALLLLFLSNSYVQAESQFFEDFTGSSVDETIWTYPTGDAPFYGNVVTAVLSPNDGTTAQNVSTPINGLQPGVTYHYRLTATNSEGTGMGNDAIFTLGDSYKLHGVNFSPIIAGQTDNTPISRAQLETRMNLVKNYTQWVRTFGVSKGLENAGAVAHSLGLKIAMGAWISNNLTANETEINNLIAAANRGEADLLIVGSETVLRAENGTTPFPGAEARIIEYLNRVKNAVPANIPVTYADTYNTLLQHPNLVAACRDVLFVNYYPYWEGIRVDKAMLDLNYKHEQVVAIAGGKKVIVSEAGWPSDGDKKGDALPSLDNASWYFLDFVSWARSKNIDYFYFEAFDSVWKTNPAVESHWGLLDSTDHFKFGMEKVLQNAILADNWSLVEGLGGPSLEFTLVPVYKAGGSNSKIYGKAKHINPSDYKVALYIYIPNLGWWVKPYGDDRRNIPLDAGGEWSVYTDTGGTDQNATQFAAFLVPKTYTIPAFGAVATLPPELYQNAVASVEVTRPLSAYPLSVVIAGSGLSQVSSDMPGISCGFPNFDCSENFAGDSTVVLKATASSGYRFTGWVGACNGTDSTCNLTINSAKSVTANFIPTQTQASMCELRVINGSPALGTVASDNGIDCGSVCSVNSFCGGLVNFTATPSSNSNQFIGWGGACSGYGNTCTVTMHAAITVTANFDVFKKKHRPAWRKLLGQWPN